MDGIIFMAKIISFEKLEKIISSIKNDAILLIELWEPCRSFYKTGRDIIKENLDNSLAVHTANALSSAASREAILAICRMWDKHSPRNNTCTLQAMSEALVDCIQYLGNESLKKSNFYSDLEKQHNYPGFIYAERKFVLENNIKDILFLINEYTQCLEAIECEYKNKIYYEYIKEYMENKSKIEKYKILEDLKIHRDKNLAHKDLKHFFSKTSFEEFDCIYLDTITIVQKSLSLINREPFDFEGFKRLKSLDAELFWSGAKGENREGHPNYPYQGFDEII